MKTKRFLLSVLSVSIVVACGSGDGGTSAESGSTSNNNATAAETYPAGSPGTGRLLVQPTTEVVPPSPDIGAFRTVCEYSHMKKDDPLVFPGQPGRSHLHTFFGNTFADASSTYDSLRTSGNSTCRGGIANRSAYWVPSLLKGDGTPLVPADSHFYYKAGYRIPNVSPQIQKIPNGLRMIAGNHAAMGAQSGEVHWKCWETNSHIHTPHIPNCPIGDFISMNVFFPQCWNGTDLDSSDHKSHMAYAIEGVGCPGTHPIPLPEVSFHVLWERTADLDVSKLRLSSDMYPETLPGGYSLHADWFEAWVPEIRDTFVTHCLNLTLDCHSHLLGDGREIFDP